MVLGCRHEHPTLHNLPPRRHRRSSGRQRQHNPRARDSVITEMACWTPERSQRCLHKVNVVYLQMPTTRLHTEANGTNHVEPKVIEKQLKAWTHAIGP